MKTSQALQNNWISFAAKSCQTNLFILKWDRNTLRTEYWKAFEKQSSSNLTPLEFSV